LTFRFNVIYILYDVFVFSDFIIKRRKNMKQNSLIISLFASILAFSSIEAMYDGAGDAPNVDAEESFAGALTRSYSAGEAIVRQAAPGGELRRSSSYPGPESVSSSDDLAEDGIAAPAPAPAVAPPSRIQALASMYTGKVDTPETVPPAFANRDPNPPSYRPGRI
jgi:hypothetical protein